VSLLQSVTTANAGSCGTGTSTSTFNYDSQRRLVSVVSGGQPTTYTAWDSAGRPTSGSFGNTTIVNTYNDATRTWVQLQATGASTSTTTTTFDANGIQLSVVNVTGPNQSTTTYTNLVTNQVCR
jgi:YD repeat-containing protein